MINNRVEKVCAALKTGEAALVCSDSNRMYLTGFPSSAGTVLITPEKAYFVIDFRYYEKAAATVQSCETVLLNNLTAQLSELFKKHGVKTLYFETKRLDVAEYLRYKKDFPALVVSESPFLDELLTGMRAVKSAEETEEIMQAQQLTDDAFTHILEYIKPGRTERETALEMEFYMRKQGSEGVSFDFIVISGKNTSLPHGVPTGKQIQSGDFVTMDFGAVVGGYRSDMTRTVAVGSVTGEQKTVYETVLKAQDAAFAVMKEEVRGCDVDKAARDVINSAGYEGCFGHALGHSVGIEIHESPACSPRCTEPLRAGTIMTVEPGIYLAGQFGVRIEDMVSVTETGYENLTKSQKELIVL